MRDAARLPTAEWKKSESLCRPTFGSAIEAVANLHEQDLVTQRPQKDAARAEAYKAGTFDVEALKTNGVKLLLG